MQSDHSSPIMGIALCGGGCILFQLLPRADNNKFLLCEILFPHNVDDYISYNRDRASHLLSAGRPTTPGYHHLQRQKTRKHLFEIQRRLSSVWKNFFFLRLWPCAASRVFGFFMLRLRSPHPPYGWKFNHQSAGADYRVWAIDKLSSSSLAAR